jgi:hypothetical protein
MPAAMSRFPSSLPYGNATAKLTSLSDVDRKASANRKIQGNGLGMIPEWQDPCQSSRKICPRFQAVEAIEIFMVSFVLIQRPE